MKSNRFTFDAVECKCDLSLRRRRRGSIALALIAVIVIAVGTFASAIARRQSYERSCELQRSEIQTLESAFNAVIGMDIQPGETIRLPLDELKKRSVIVTKTDSDGTFTLEATLMNDDKPGLFIRRKFQANSSNDSDSSE